MLKNLENLGTEAALLLAAKAGTKAGAEAFVKGNTKSAKMLGKASKLTPGVGTGISLVEAGFRLGTGDTTGAALSVLSAIPVAGWAFTAIDIARDMGYNPDFLNMKQEQDILKKDQASFMVQKHV